MLIFLHIFCIRGHIVIESIHTWYPAPFDVRNQPAVNLQHHQEEEQRQCQESFFRSIYYDCVGRADRYCTSPNLLPGLMVCNYTSLQLVSIAC